MVVREDDEEEEKTERMVPTVEVLIMQKDLPDCGTSWGVSIRC